MTISPAPPSDSTPPDATPDVSIVMAVHNGAATLAAAMRSILNQTLETWELILIDDASTDDVQSIIDQFNDPRIKHLHNERNLGLAASLNRGIALATAPYIARMDADDICYPTRLEKQLTYLKEHPEIDLLGCAKLTFHKQGEILGIAPVRTAYNAIRLALLGGAVSLYHSTWMGKAGWFRRYGYDPTHHAEDFEIMIRALPHSHYANLPDILLGYRLDFTTDLHKRLQRRISNVQAAIHNTVSITDGLKALLITGACLAKSAGDIVITSLWGSPSLGKTRFKSVSAEERAQWERLWSDLHPSQLHKP